MTYNRLYKLSDDLSLDLTYKSITCKYKITIDEGIEYENEAGTAEEIINGLATSLGPQLGMDPAALLEMLALMTVEDNSEHFFFRANDNIVLTNYEVGEAGSLFSINLIKVLENGTYTFAGNWQIAEDGSNTINLNAGWYTVIDLREQEYTYTIPIGIASLKKIDEKFMPESYLDLKKAIPYVDMEFGDVPEYDSSKTYYSGEICTHNYRLYKATGTTSGEFNISFWEKITDKTYYYVYYKGTQNEIQFNDFVNLRKQGKQFRIWLLPEYSSYFDANYDKTIATDNEITICFKMITEGLGLELYISNKRDYYDEKEPTNHLPYVLYTIEGPAYMVVSNTTSKGLLTEYINDKKVIAYRQSSSSPTHPVIICSIADSYTYNNQTYSNVPYITYKGGNYFITKYYCDTNVVDTLSVPILKDIIVQSVEAPTDNLQIWVTGNSVSGFSAKLKLWNEWLEIGNTSAMWCILTESNNVYSCDKTPQEIYKAFMAGTPVYIKYMGLPIPVVNAVYNLLDDKYYINATITSVVGEELIGRQIGFDGTTWSIDFNDSFIVRGAGSLANIGKYLKATANGVMWDTPEGGGGTVEALSDAEMMELFADTGINETAGLEYNEYAEDAEGIYIYDEELGDYRLLDQSDPNDYYVEDEEGDHVYDETTHEYRPYVEGDTGTRYSLRRRYNYVDSGFAGYVEYIEDENGDYVWDEELQVYRLYEEGDTGTRYSVGETYILIY